MSKQTIVIIGFMGCGKTTVAQQLAGDLSCEWVDLDDEITKHDGRTPGAIIEQDGEAAFRETEQRILRQVLSSGLVSVIAAGGGAWTIPENRKLIAQHDGLAVWLDAPFEACWKRIEANKMERPLAPTRELAQRLYDQRLPLYGLSDVQIPVEENQTPEQITREITLAISQHIKHG